MRHLSVLLASLSLTIPLAGPVTAQRGGAAGAVQAPRPLGPVVARSSQTFQSMARLFTLRGSVFVDDPAARQVWMLDSLLGRPRVVLDSVSGAGRGNWYGPAGSSSLLRRFRGDSALFTGSRLAVEGLILDADGRVARVAAMPQVSVKSATQGCYDLADVDNTGWFTCHAGPTTRMSITLAGSSSRAVLDSVRRKDADTAAIVAVSFATWDVDTIGFVSVGPHERITLNRPVGGSVTLGVQYPMILVDAWTMLRDGTLVIARGADYHLDIVNTRREVTRGPRAPYAWSRVSESDQRHLLDSLARVDSAGRVRADSAHAALLAAGRASATAAASPFRAPPDEWPMYWPPFHPQTPLVDEADRIWIHERPPIGGDSIQVYGIFDRHGQFIDRIKVSASETVVGFGPGNLVYLTTKDGGRSTILAARLR